MKKVLVVVAVVVVAGLVWSLSQKPAEAPTPSGTGVETGSEVLTKLTVTTWVWQETQMNDGEIITPNQPGAFAVTFKPDGSLNGTTDCNGFFGTYTLADTKIEFGPLGSTLMYCEGSQEQVFTGYFEHTDFVFFTEEDNLVLLLRYDSGSVFFAPAE